MSRAAVLLRQRAGPMIRRSTSRQVPSSRWVTSFWPIVMG